MSIVRITTLIAAATLALSACQSNTATTAAPTNPNAKKSESISRHAVSPATTRNSTTPVPGGIEATRVSSHDATTDNPPGSTSTSGYTTTNMGRVSSHRNNMAPPPGAPPATTTTTSTTPMTTKPGAPTMTPGVVSNEPYFQDDKPAMMPKKK